MTAKNTAGKNIVGIARSGDRPLLRRKSVLMGMLTSGFVIANVAQSSPATAGTVKPSTITGTPPTYATKWMPSTPYALGTQVISPKNDVVSANVAHTSSTTYDADMTKWALSPTYARQNGDVFNVKDFGATGNGTTNDTTAVQAALRAATTGATVWFPPGTYVLEGIDGTGISSVSLEGVRGKSILQYKAAPTRTMIGWNMSAVPGVNDSRLSFRGLTFRGSTGLSEMKFLLSLSAVDDVRIDNCDFIQFQGDAIYLGRTQVGGADNGCQNRRIKITNSLFDGVDYTNRNAISIITGDDVLIESNTFTRCAHASMPGAIDIEPNDWDHSAIIRDLKIINNSFINVGGSNGTLSFAFMPSTFTTQPARIQITGNTFRGSKQSDVYLLWAGHSATDTDPLTTIRVSGNMFAAADTGATQRTIQVNGLRGIDVEGNIFTNRSQGVLQAGTGSAVRDLNIRHNTITDCGASSGQIILLGNAAKCTVERNSVAFTTPITSHFVYLYNGGTSNTINVLDNTLRGISYCATVDGSHATTTSTNRCRGNIGAAANSMASWTGATAVTGARGGNAAMASLLTALAASGLIVDSTTA